MSDKIYSERGVTVNAFHGGIVRGPMLSVTAPDVGGDLYLADVKALVVKLNGWLWRVENRRAAMDLQWLDDREGRG